MVGKNIFNTATGKFRLDTDFYLHEAMLAVLSSDKYAFESGKSLPDGMLLKIQLVDQLENVAAGLGIIFVGTDPEGKEYNYTHQVNEFWASERVQKESDELTQKVWKANFKLRLICAALRARVPMDVKFIPHKAVKKKIDYDEEPGLEE